MSFLLLSKKFKVCITAGCAFLSNDKRNMNDHGGMGKYADRAYPTRL